MDAGNENRRQHWLTAERIDKAKDVLFQMLVDIVTGLILAALIKLLGL